MTDRTLDEAMRGLPPEVDLRNHGLCPYCPRAIIGSGWRMRTASLCDGSCFRAPTEQEKSR